MNKIKRFILNNKFLAPIAITIKSLPHEIRLNTKTRNKIKKIAKSSKPRIFYIGVPAHNNLGDLAQGVCIRRWLKKHYPGYAVVEIETNALVNTRFSVLKHLKKAFLNDDVIVLQSGYTTTDLGGHADEMHCAIIKNFPQAKILMMPQTIFFKSEERKKNTSLIYNSAKNMLFLARDRVSFDMAREMFPDISIRLYPDIVTTLIGKYKYENERSGILFCCRNDGEKYYSDKDIADLMKRCEKFAKVDKTDTTKKIPRSEIVKNAEVHIMSEIERYSKYKLLITDRYHGTILSLVAGTPVIIIKTTDHKVVTGADWFKGVYDDYVFVAQDLDEAYQLAKDLYSKQLSHNLESYFEEEYYDKLPQLFQDKIGDAL